MNDIEHSQLSIQSVNLPQIKNTFLNVTCFAAEESEVMVTYPGPVQSRDMENETGGKGRE